MKDQVEFVQNLAPGTEISTRARCTRLHNPIVIYYIFITGSLGKCSNVDSTPLTTGVGRMWEPQYADYSRYEDVRYRHLRLYFYAYHAHLKVETITASLLSHSHCQQ